LFTLQNDTIFLKISRVRRDSNIQTKIHSEISIGPEMDPPEP